MPTYCWKCDECDHRSEARADFWPTCPNMHGPMRRDYKAEKVNINPRMALRQTARMTDAEDLSPRG